MKKIAKMMFAVVVCLLILFGCGIADKDPSQTESQKLESENQRAENTEVESEMAESEIASETENGEDNTEEDDLSSTSTMATPSNSGALQVIGTQLCDASGNGAIDENQANAWIELLNEKGVSYCGWNISNKAETSAIINASCTKTSGWTEEDLSESGKWQYHMLRKYQLEK